MDARGALIDQITQELHQLPDDYLGTVFSVVERMRAQLTKDKPSEPTTRPGSIPFVDEIERVREQSRRGAGSGEDQQFA